MSRENFRPPQAFELWRKGRSGADALVSDYWRDYLKTDPDLTGLSSTIEIVFGPDIRVFVSTSPVSVTSSSTGSVYQYLPILSEEPSVKSSFKLGDAGSSARSFSLRIPNRLVDAARILRSGRFLAGFAEVSLQYDGGDYDNRLVVMRGEVDGGVTYYPQEGGVIELSVTDPKTSCDYTCPPYVVDKNTLPNAPDNSLGKRYPLVLGNFDSVPCMWSDSVGTGPSVHGSPVAMVSYGTTTVRTSNIYVDGIEYASSHLIWGWEIVESSDRKGNAYTGVQFNNTSGAFTTNLTESIHVDVTEGNTKSTNVIEQALYLIQGFTGLDASMINLQLFSKAASRMGILKCNALVNAGGEGAASTLGFIEDTLLQPFPMISMVWEGNGYGPVYVDRNIEPVLDLDLTQAPILGRIGGVQESPRGDLTNSFALQYQYNALEDVYRGIIVRDFTTSNLCAISARTAGERQGPIVETPYVSDDATAGAVVDWWVGHLAMPKYNVSYLCHGVVYLKVGVGDNVLLTDEEFGWVKNKATVQGVEYKAGTCKLNLIVWDTYFGVHGGSATGGMPSGQSSTTTGGQQE